MPKSMNPKKGIKFVFLIVSIFIISSCANPLNRATSQRYYKAGLEAEQQGQLALARENYRRALINVEAGNLSDEEKAYLSYEYGRLSGYLCDSGESEKYLRQAIELKEKLNVAERSKSKNYFELARFYYDHNKYSQAIPYFQKGVPIVEKMDIEKADPIAFANLLDEYADTLRKTNHVENAQEIALKADKIRESNPDAHAKFTPTRYNQKCQ